MNFSLNEEQQMLADTVARFVQTAYDFETRRKRLAAAPKGNGYSEALWSQLADMGLFALNVPSEHGGIGGGPVETMIVMEQLGRGLVLEPFLATGVVAARLIGQHGTPAQQDRFLGAIAAGKLRFALAFLEPQARYDLHDVTSTATRCGDGWLLTGNKSVVLHGDSADWLLVSARTRPGATTADEGLTLMLVDARAPGVTAQGFGTIDGQRAAELSFDGVHVDHAAILGRVDGGLPLVEWCVDQGLAALAAEAVGAMDRLTDLTCDYLATRKQFGVAIGSFQALQHRAADMRIAVEQARALALMAAAQVDSNDRNQRRRAASAAKAMAGRSGRFVGQQATQLHGGMGMTDEMACGHYFKRLTAIDMSWGNTEHHIESYGELL